MADHRKVPDRWNIAQLECYYEEAGSLHMDPPRARAKAAGENIEQLLEWMNELAAELGLALQRKGE